MEAIRGGLRLRPVDVAFGVEQLPLQIREFDDISVDESKMPDAGPGEEVGGNAPEGPQSHHDGPSTCELALALDTNLRKDFLSTVPIGRPHGGQKGAPLMGLSPAITAVDDANRLTSQPENSFRLAPLGDGDCMDSMVSTAPSAWLTMENALDRLTRDFTILTVLVLILVAVSLLSWFRTGVLDLGFVLALAVLIALRDIGAFCRGAMDRMRRLSQMV